jgi:3-oxoacyl-[acyl-carrier protein] reductase
LRTIAGECYAGDEEQSEGRERVTMDLGVRDRVAIVSAASQGLGKAAATVLAREGARVAICSRNKERIEAAAGEIRAAVEGAVIVPLVADVTRPDQILALVSSTLAAFQRIDILVTNAGGPPAGAFLALTDADWERGMSLSLFSTIRLIRAVVPEMQKRKWGRIINITSLSVKQPITDLIVSSTIRPGVLGLSKVLSQQLGADGILINTVAPGYFLTARQRDISVARANAKGVSLESYLQELSAEVPLQRLGEPEELANVIAFLASERASYVTGTVVAVDGGTIRGLF